MFGVLGIVDGGVYDSITNGVQAVGVVVALSLAAATLIRDNRDRRVDRVLSLHQELMNGSVWEARYRLVYHLRAHGYGGSVRRVTRQELNEDPSVSQYRPGIQGNPAQDADLLVRYFERAYAALRTDALDVPLFAELIGRHAIWWDLVLVQTPDWLTRAHLTRLAGWTRAYVAKNRRNSQVAMWIEAAEGDVAGHTEAAATEFSP